MGGKTGLEPKETLTEVIIKLVEGTVPIFGETYYNVSVSEGHALHAPFFGLKAEATVGNQVFYKIDNDPDVQNFALDFSTGKFSFDTSFDSFPNTFGLF